VDEIFAGIISGLLLANVGVTFRMSLVLSRHLGEHQGGTIASELARHAAACAALRRGGNRGNH
jgi:hypothetical protein